MEIGCIEVALLADSFTFLLTRNSKLNTAVSPRSLATTPAAVYFVLNVRAIADMRFHSLGKPPALCSYIFGCQTLQIPLYSQIVAGAHAKQ